MATDRDSCNTLTTMMVVSSPKDLLFGYVFICMHMAALNAEKLKVNSRQIYCFAGGLIDKFIALPEDKEFSTFVHPASLYHSTAKFAKLEVWLLASY